MMFTRTSLLLAALSTFTAVGLSTGNEIATEGGEAPLVTLHDAGPLAGSIDPARCPLPGDPGPGTHGMWVTHESTTRPYTLHVPASYDGFVPAPLVVGLHGFGADGQQHALASGTDALSEIEGFVALYPEGFGGSWNAGGCCGAASVAGLDDVGYIVGSIREAASMFCIDPERIYLTGTDNGGTMAYRLACEASDVFAAAAIVSGELPDILCMPSRPIPVIAFHSTLGEEVSYESGEESFMTWASLNDCAGIPTMTDHAGTFCDTFESCAGESSLSFCTVDPVWAGIDLDLGWHAWTFLSQHSLF